MGPEHTSMSSPPCYCRSDREIRNGPLWTVNHISNRRISYVWRAGALHGIFAAAAEAAGSLPAWVIDLR